jgi:hypothetical protein
MKETPCHPATAPSPPASSPAIWPFGTSPTPPKVLHAIQLLIDAAVTSLAAACNCQLRWHRGPRIVPVADNYDRLRIPPDAVSRDVRYTR